MTNTAYMCQFLSALKIYAIYLSCVWLLLLRDHLGLDVLINPIPALHFFEVPILSYVPPIVGSSVLFIHGVPLTYEFCIFVL